MAQNQRTLARQICKGQENAAVTNSKSAQAKSVHLASTARRSRSSRENGLDLANFMVSISAVAFHRVDDMFNQVAIGSLNLAQYDR